MLFFPAPVSPSFFNDRVIRFSRCGAVPGPPSWSTRHPVQASFKSRPPPLGGGGRDGWVWSAPRRGGEGGSGSNPSPPGPTSGPFLTPIFDLFLAQNYSDASPGCPITPMVSQAACGTTTPPAGARSSRRTRPSWSGGIRCVSSGRTAALHTEAPE